MSEFEREEIDSDEEMSLYGKRGEEEKGVAQSHHQELQAQAFLNLGLTNQEV